MFQLRTKKKKVCLLTHSYLKAHKYLFVSTGSVPPEMQVVPINATAVNVTWQHDNDAMLKGYMIHLRNLSADDGTTVIQLPPKTRHYVLNHLGKHRGMLGNLEFWG